jgi:hypothetical protein
VKVAIDELGRGGPERAALDRAVRRVTGRTLDQALRDFQVWSLLTGPRDDHRHFSFASRLGGPSFTSTVEALPALSVQADPELAPMGFAAVLLKPGERSGGMNVRFEGDLTTRWAADLLLIRDNGTMHLAPLSLDADQAAELTVPLQGVAEAVLLVRNHDADAKAWGRYTWGARLVPGYPVEFGELKAEPAGDAGMRVSWQTEGEREVLGFNVLRFRGEAGPAIRINPVWIPPIGGGEAQAAYSFLDTTAEPGITYRYRVEAVTPEGLTSRSELVPPSSAH